MYGLLHPQWTHLIDQVWEVSQSCCQLGRQFCRGKHSRANNVPKGGKFPLIPKPALATVGDDRFSRRRPRFKKDLLENSLMEK